MDSWGKFNKWIVILQEFDLDFQSAKSKKSLVFAELIAEFPVEEDVAIEEDSFPDDHIFFYFHLWPLVWRYTYLSPYFEVPYNLLMGRTT